MSTTTFLRSPMPHDIRPDIRRVDEITTELKDLEEMLAFEQEDLESAEERVRTCEAAIERYEGEIEELTNERKRLADTSISLGPFGELLPGPGEYGERLLDEMNRTPPVPPYGAPLIGGAA